MSGGRAVAQGRSGVRYSIVIPVYNEQDNVLPLAEEIIQVLGSGPAFEVLFVDDGSSDATAERLAAAKHRLPGIRLLRHTARSGKSAALLTGFKAARADWVVTMDGDRQNDPADVPALLAATMADPAVVLAAGMRRRRIDSTAKRLASRAANRIRRALLHDDCPDTGCGMKLIRRDVFLALPFFDAMHRFLPALVRQRGHAYVNVPINDRARTAGQSKYSNLGRAVAGLFDLAGVVWLRKRTTLPPAVTEV